MVIIWKLVAAKAKKPLRKNQEDTTRPSTLGQADMALHSTMGHNKSLDLEFKEKQHSSAQQHQASKS